MPHVLLDDVLIITETFPLESEVSHDSPPFWVSMNLLRRIQYFLLSAHSLLFLALQMLNEMKLPLLLVLSWLKEVFSESLVLIRIDFVRPIGSQFGIKWFFLALLKKFWRIYLIDLFLYFSPELFFSLHVLHPETIK